MWNRALRCVRRICWVSGGRWSTGWNHSPRWWVPGWSLMMVRMASIGALVVIRMLIRVIGCMHGVRIIVTSRRCMMIVRIFCMMVHHWGRRWTSITVMLVAGWVHRRHSGRDRRRTNSGTAIGFNVPIGDGRWVIAVSTFHCRNAANYCSAKHIISRLV